MNNHDDEKNLKLHPKKILTIVFVCPPHMEKTDRNTFPLASRWGEVEVLKNKFKCTEIWRVAANIKEMNLNNLKRWPFEVSKPWMYKILFSPPPPTNRGCETHPAPATSKKLLVPAQPKARWYLEVGLNFTQQTLALASMLATELSRLVDHNLTETQRHTHTRWQEVGMEAC